MSTIPLNDKSGKAIDFAIIDDDQFETVSKFKWHKTHYGYAKRSRKRKVEDTKSPWMHRLIYESVYGPIESGFIDHIDRNRLNNKITNLRKVNALQNALNKGKTDKNTTGYIGVSIDKRFEGKTRYIARVSINNKPKTICYTDSAREAALIRDLYMSVLYPNEVVVLNIQDASPEEIESAKKALSTAKTRKSSSKFVGVQLDKRRNTWNGCIRVNDRNIYLGRFDTEEDAAKAYDNYCISNNLNRKLNFKDNSPSPIYVK